MQSKTSVLIATSAVLAAALLLPNTGVRGADLADLPRATPEEVGMSSARLDRVSALMQRYIDGRPRGRHGDADRASRQDRAFSRPKAGATRRPARRCRRTRSSRSCR